MSYEDFLKYEEADPNNKITVTKNKIDVENAAWATHCYVRDDKGPGHFGDFEILVDSYLDSQMGNGVYACIWSLTANSATKTYDQMNTNNDGITVVAFHQADITSRYYLIDRTNDNTDFGDVGNDDTWFYHKIKRVGTTLTDEIYSDRARTPPPVDTLSIVCGANVYQYVFGFMNRGGGTNVVYLEIENLDLQEAKVPMGLTLKPAPKGGTGRPALLTGGGSFGG